MNFREPEWTDEMKARKRGATTFKECGWCVHAEGGPGRYGALLRPKCGLDKSYAPVNEFDTKCKIVEMSKEQLQELADCRREYVDHACHTIRRHSEDMVTLLVLAGKK